MPSTTDPPEDTGRTGASAHAGGAAFLLAQVGAHAAAGFAERVAQLGLTPAQTGLLRAVASSPGRSQQQLATHLGLLPSRVVAFVDDLEERGLLRRERSATDRRQYALHLTDTGRAMMRKVGSVARAHQRDLCRSLDDDERLQLTGLLARIAHQEGLTPGVHPGFRTIDSAAEPHP